MRICSRFFAALVIAVASLGAQASTSAPQNGVDYKTLETPQNTDAGKKVEVTEFFWYACPHCYAIDPQLSAWVKKQGDNIVFKRVHVSFGESMLPQQKLYYTLEALGRTEDLNKKVFQAVHVERNPLQTDAAVLAFAVKNGLDKQKFLDVYNSFAIQAKVKRAMQLASAYKIDGVPTIAIDGKYMTSPQLAEPGMPASTPRNETNMQIAALQVMDALVARAAKEKAPAAAPAKKAKK